MYEMDEAEMRHADHRFEWAQAEFAEWCARWTEAFDYTAQIKGIGEFSAEFGFPTQMAVFRRGDYRL
ncbi:hypothetical protein D3C73_1531790 [compost metagenome]